MMKQMKMNSNLKKLTIINYTIENQPKNKHLNSKNNKMMRKKMTMKIIIKKNQPLADKKIKKINKRKKEMIKMIMTINNNNYKRNKGKCKDMIVLL